MAKGGNRMIQPMSTPMALLITSTAGLIIFLVYLMIIPYIGGTVQNTMPSTGVTSVWNSTYNTALPNPATIYTNVIPIVTACVTFIFLGLLFFYLRGMIF
jgi:hypothetical protein